MRHRSALSSLILVVFACEAGTSRGLPPAADPDARPIEPPIRPAPPIPIPLPAVASYLLDVTALEANGTAADPSGLQTIRMDVMEEGQLDEVSVALFPEWAEGTTYFHGHDESADVRLDAGLCCSCFGLPLALEQDRSSAQLDELRLLRAQASGGRLSWWGDGTFSGWAVIAGNEGEASGRVRGRVDDEAPRSRFHIPQRGFLLPWETLRLQFSEPVENAEDASRAVRSTFDGTAATTVEVSGGAAGSFGFGLKADGWWPNGTTARFEIGAVLEDKMRNRGGSASVELPLIPALRSAARFGLDDDSDEEVFFFGRWAPEGFNGQGCWTRTCPSFAITQGQSAGLVAHIEAEPFDRVIAQVRILSEKCEQSSLGPVGITPTARAPGSSLGTNGTRYFYPQPSDRGPSYTCETDWTELEIPLGPGQLYTEAWLVIELTPTDTLESYGALVVQIDEIETR